MLKTAVVGFCLKLITYNSSNSINSRQHLFKCKSSLKSKKLSHMKPPFGQPFYVMRKGVRLKSLKNHEHSIAEGRNLSG